MNSWMILFGNMCLYLTCWITNQYRENNIYLKLAGGWQRYFGVFHKVEQYCVLAIFIRIYADVNMLYNYIYLLVRYKRGDNLNINQFNTGYIILTFGIIALGEGVELIIRLTIKESQE